jgi:hypothetical protein
MQNMLPGNSFPQICVVSVNKYVENLEVRQEYGWALALSNHTYILSSNYADVRLSFTICGADFSVAARLNVRIESSIRLSAPVFFINWLTYPLTVR